MKKKDAYNGPFERSLQVVYNIGPSGGIHSELFFTVPANVCLSVFPSHNVLLNASYTKSGRQPVWPDKNPQMSIKVAQKWFH